MADHTFSSKQNTMNAPGHPGVGEAHAPAAEIPGILRAHAPAADAPGILQTRDLAAGYRGTPVVEQITLFARAGEIVSLIGPNGAGKSTILKTLIRQLSPMAGVIFLTGENLRNLSDTETARRSAAVLTGRPSPELMTCGEVVETGRYPYTGRLGILSAEDIRIVDEVMHQVGIGSLRDRPFEEISDGQRQRVMLARAICQEPKLLILDEPTSFLDIRYKLEFLHLLRQLVRERELAVVMSMHELDLAQRFSDRILCVKDGRIHREGSPEEIFSGTYISELYGLTCGSCDNFSGTAEAQRNPGQPRVFVIGGGGAGIPVYRRLWRQGIPFAAGVLPENDLDVPTARALAAELVTCSAFTEVGEAEIARAMEILEGCESLICAVETFGPVNEKNRRLLEYARAKGRM